MPELRPVPKAALEFLIVAAVVALLGYVLLQIQLVVLPAILALFLATGLAPLQRRLHAMRVPRAGAAFLCVLLAVVVVGVVIAVVVPAFVDEFSDVENQVRAGVDEVVAYLEDGPLDLSQNDIDDAVDRALETVRDNAGGIGQGVLTAGTVALEVVASALLILVLTFYFLYDGKKIWAWVLSFTPARHRDAVHAFGIDVLGGLGGYLRGVVFVATVDAVLIGAGLFTLGVPLVVPLMVLTFMAAFIPIAGAFTAGAVAALVALVSEGALDAVLVIVIVTAVQQIEGNLLYPIVVGRRAELHPVAILLAVACGGVLYGIAGAALGVPIAIVVWTAIRHVRRQEVVADTGAVLLEAPDP